MSNLLKANPRKKHMFIRLCLLTGLCIGAYHLGTQTKTNQDTSNVLNAKDEIIFELKDKYNTLLVEHKKSQALINTITDELKRLTQQLKEEYQKEFDSELIFDETKIDMGISIVSEHIKKNEAFSAIPYCDSDGKYRNGYGTLAKMTTYKVGDTIELRNCKGKIEIITITENNQFFPERNISEPEALHRKKNHLLTHVFPYLYNKKFRTSGEFIVATDTIYNRGIGQCKRLFNPDGTINCESLHAYMSHSQPAYQSAMEKRYTKNYALCIQS